MGTVGAKEVMVDFGHWQEIRATSRDMEKEDQERVGGLPAYALLRANS